MAKRLSDSELWNQDWFLDLSGTHQLFVLYIRDHCDHAGIWQPSKKRFFVTTGLDIDLDEFFESVNADKDRVILLENKKWWLTGFIEDQYKGSHLCYTIPSHKGVIRLLENNNVPYKSYGYDITLKKMLKGA